MERRMKAKQGLHSRSKSFSEEPVNSLGNHQMHRQATYDDSQIRKMDVDEDQGVWMNSFSSWKMKRMRATSSERDRKAERDEVEETQEKLKRKKSKTFREIVEEKQKREKALQSGKVDLQSLGVGEITSILADLPSTNLDSDNEPEAQTSPPIVEERMQPRLERQKREETHEEPDLRKGLIRRSNTLPTNRTAQDGSVKRAPPPVKPKPRSRSGSLHDRSNSIEQNFIEPEIFTTTDSRSTFSAPPPSQRPATEIITATSTISSYAAPPPAARPKSPPTMRPKSPPTMRPKSPPIMRPKTTPSLSLREPEPVDKPLGFHEKLSKARQYEKETEDAQQKAKEAARKPYKPKRSSIFAKIRAFDTGQAFIKGPEEESSPKVEEKRKADTEGDDYEDLVIIMSQKARSSRGFGFQTSGGYDERKPLVVSSVSKGSVADYSDLQVGDEILSINKESTRKFNQDDVHQCLSQSILTGKLTCKVRRYPDGKPPEKTAVKEPVFQRSNPSRQESQPPPVQSHPPPAHQPVRTAQPPVERVTVPPKEDPVQIDVDVLRPGPTKNALARARQMLDELEIEDKEDESLESSSKSSDIVEPSSSLPPTNRQSSKPLSYSQPIKSNGYLPHADKQEEEDWAPNASMEVRVGTPQSLQESEDSCPLNGPQVSLSDPTPETESTDPCLNESFSQCEDFDDNESGVAPLNLASDEGRDGNSMDEESVSSEDSRQPTQRYRPNLQSQGRIIRHTPTSSQDESSSQDFQPKSSFRSVSAPKPYQPRAPEPYKPSVQKEPSYGRSDINQRRSEFFRELQTEKERETADEDDNEKPLDEMNNLWKQVEEPVVAKDEETSEMMPIYRPIKPSTAHRRPFNREEERKRLERWNEEQDRRRQEKYQLEQQRLFEEQERTLQAAAEEVQKKREEEERNLEERRRSIQKQEEELRQIRLRQMEEEENRRKARLEQERREREEAERERKEAEERREKERAEEERRRRELMERERMLREAAEKERLAREKEEEERRKTEKLQREREQREKEAQEEIRKQQEEYAKMLKEKEKERIEQQRMQAEAEQKRQEEEEAERERQEVEKWRLENEEREKAAKLKAEQSMAMQEEAQRRFEAEERERIRAEEREKMKREWEEERKQYLEQLQQEKEKLQREREELAKRQEEEKKKLQLEMSRIKKERELEQKNITELPLSKMTNGDVMSAPNQQLGRSHSPRTRGSPQNGHSPRNGQSPRTVSPGTQRLKDNNQRNMLPERDHPQSHSNMSQYKDPNIPVSQHWLIEEAERRRRAEEQGIDRKLPPDVVIPPQNDIQVPQKSLHTRHPNPYPKGFDPEIPTRLPAQRKQQSQEAPASTNAVQRRLRKPEAEAERQRKLQNRRSLPDLTGGRDNAVPSSRNPNGPQRGSGQATESPISRSSDRGQHSIPGQGSAFQEPNKNIPSNQAISGKLQCCNCGKALGRGAAMIIESLGLHYHVECFRCCVCNIRLGNGTKGADVRIRASQLHCQNCYSNEAGFQFTEV